MVAIIGTARIAPGIPQRYHQKIRPMNTATVLSRIRRPRIIGVIRLPSSTLMTVNTTGTSKA